MKKIEIDLNEFNDLVEKGYNILELSKYFKCSKWKINDYRLQNNITRKFGTNLPIVLTETQISVLYGALLGDGSLPNVKNGNTNFIYGSSLEEHVQFILNYFKGYLYSECLEKPKYSEVYDKRTKKYYTSYRMRTRANIAFQNIRNEWYKDGIKIIPSNIRLNPLICLIWYIGDGHISNTGVSSNHIKLSTDGFDPKYVIDVLIPQLKDFDAYLRYRNKEKTQSCIIIPRMKIREFLSYIGECPVECYRYKWIYKPTKSKRVDEFGVNYFGDKIQSFIEEYLEGKKISEISKKYNCDGGLVRFYLKKYNIKMRDEKVKFLITYENNETEIVDNLKKYTIENNLVYLTFYAYVDKNKKFKGRLISKIKK